LPKACDLFFRFRERDHTAAKNAEGEVASRLQNLPAFGLDFMEERGRVVAAERRLQPGRTLQSY